LSCLVIGFILLMIGRKKPTRPMVRRNNSIMPRAIRDFPLFGSVEVMNRFFDMVLVDDWIRAS